MMHSYGTSTPLQRAALHRMELQPCKTPSLSLGCPTGLSAEHAVCCCDKSAALCSFYFIVPMLQGARAPSPTVADFRFISTCKRLVGVNMQRYNFL